MCVCVCVCVGETGVEVGVVLGIGKSVRQENRASSRHWEIPGGAG